MAINMDIENDEFAYLFFYLQYCEGGSDDPVLEKIINKMETLIYSRFSIEEIERYRSKVIESRTFGAEK